MQSILSKKDYDIPLNKQGVKQARRIRPYIEALPIQMIYHSPLIRAKQTMEIVSFNLTYKQTEIEQLKECSKGVWLNMNSMEKKEGSISNETKRFFHQVITAMVYILENNKTPLIIAHGGIHFALCYLLAIKNHSKAVENCSLVHFHPIGTAV